MKKRYIAYGIWLILAAGLYFFENNTGTRALLLCSLLPLPVPVFRRLFFIPDRAEGRRLQPVRVTAVSDPEEEDAGDVGVYRPGDPVNRIHWKLSAKKNELLVRKACLETLPEEKPKPVPVPDDGDRRGKRRADRKKRILAGLAALLLLLLLCLAAVPGLRGSAAALCNRLFDASERVNDYVYAHFPVQADRSVLPAALWLAAALALVLGMAAVSGRRWPVFCMMACCAGFQVYFGLSLPFWAQAALFAAFALWMAGRPLTRHGALKILAAVLAAILVVLAVYPGVDAATETASERVRDALGRMAPPAGGILPEDAEGENETRRTHDRSLIRGEREAGTEKEYRLVTEEKEQVSAPRWLDLLRTVFLFLAAIALVVLPFLPFLVMNAHRKKAMAARAAFDSEDVGEAVCAVFGQVVAWLEAMGLGGGNLPYRDWSRGLSAALSPEYARRFSRCAELFEEAAYSSHEMREDQRQQALSLLEETEQALLAGADWKQKIRLRVGGLWITETE